MKTTIFTLLVAILLFSCSTEEPISTITEDTNSNAKTNTTSSRRGGVEFDPIIFPDVYYVYTIQYRDGITPQEKKSIQLEYAGSYGIFHYQQSEAYNIEYWYATLNPALVEPSLGGHEGDDGDFEVTDLNSSSNTIGDGGTLNLGSGTGSGGLGN